MNYVVMISVILLLGVAFASGTAYNPKVPPSCRGEVYAVPMASGANWLLTTHDTKLYVLREAATIPTEPPKQKRGK